MVVKKVLRTETNHDHEQIYIKYQTKEVAGPVQSSSTRLEIARLPACKTPPLDTANLTIHSDLFCNLQKTGCAYTSRDWKRRRCAPMFIN
jgi:hypothetical protein